MADTITQAQVEELEDMRDRLNDRYANTPPGDPVVIDVLVDAVDRLLLMASEPPASSVGRDNIRDAITEALHLAKSPSAEELALRESAENFADTPGYIGEHRLFAAARTYARSVEKR